MSKKKYNQAPSDISEAIEQAEVIADFLPPPDQLVLKEETVRVTLNLNKQSVDFFKLRARENGIPYQRMIRKVLDIYAERFLHGHHVTTVGATLVVALISGARNLRTIQASFPFIAIKLRVIHLAEKPTVLWRK